MLRWPSSKNRLDGRGFVLCYLRGYPHGRGTKRAPGTFLGLSRGVSRLCMN
jgi:hypothetical protein